MSMVNISGDLAGAQIKRLRDMELDEDELRILHAYLAGYDPNAFKQALDLIERTRSL